MTAQQIIKLILAEKKLSFQKASEIIGLPRRSALSNIVYSPKSLNLDTFVHVLNGLGYTLLVQEESSKKCFVVDKTSLQETEKNIG